MTATRPNPDPMSARYRHFERLKSACQRLAPLPTAVACPEDRNSLAGALQARDEGLIDPVLVGDPNRIAQAAELAGQVIGSTEIVAADGEAACAGRAVGLVHDGRVRAVMKGNLHSDTLLAQVVRREGGLRTTRRISHVFVLDVPGFDRLLHVTDGALNIAPSLEAKVDIAGNAIELARACGAEPPKVAALSAVETVNPQMPSSLDAALLARMAARGQISGALVDGPLAMDNAVSIDAARIKGIDSEVAGRADVLLVPTIEAGNMVVKALTFVAGGETAGIVLGAQVPVMLTSRADSALAREISCVLALLLDDFRRQGHSLLASS